MKGWTGCQRTYSCIHDTYQLAVLKYGTKKGTFRKQSYLTIFMHKVALFIMWFHSMEGWIGCLRTYSCIIFITPINRQFWSRELRREHLENNPILQYLHIKYPFSSCGIHSMEGWISCQRTYSCIHDTYQLAVLK
jgi:hypothetical protein